MRGQFIYLKLKDGRIIHAAQKDISLEEREELLALVSKNCEKL